MTYSLLLTIKRENLKGKPIRPAELAQEQAKVRMERIMSGILKTITDEKTTVYEFIDICANVQRVCNLEIIRVLQTKPNPDVKEQKQ